MQTFRVVEILRTLEVLFIGLLFVHSPQNTDGKICSPVKYENGYMQVRPRGLRGTYTCDRGFLAHPSDRVKARCNTAKGKWNVDPPFCIAPGPECLLQYMTVTGGHLIDVHEGKMDLLRLECFPGYQPEGVTVVWCNSKNWNQTHLRCSPEPTTPPEIAREVTTFSEKTTAPSSTKEPFTTAETTQEISPTVEVTEKRHIPTKASAGFPGFNSENGYRNRNSGKSSDRKNGLAIGLPISVVAVLGCFIMIALYVKNKRKQAI